MRIFESLVSCFQFRVSIFEFRVKCVEFRGRIFKFRVREADGSGVDGVRQTCK